MRSRVGGVFLPTDVERVAASARERADGDGRAGAELRDELQRIEHEHEFTPAARQLFEQLLATLGVASSLPIGFPLDDTPYWLRDPHPLGGFRSATELPARADVLIIGAGLTGASAAYHLRDAAAAGRQVVVVDKGDPACEASGRNSGHFEMIPENSVGLYEGLASERFRFLSRCYANVPVEVLHAEAERQASAVLAVTVRNRERMRNIIHGDGIACDFSPRGWLFLAQSDREEQAICDEVLLAAQHGERIELWARHRINEAFGFTTDRLGRFVPGDGCYHPFKYACGLLERARRAGVQLYARVPVKAIRSESDGTHTVVTVEGEISADRVIVATNAFTRDLLPELAAIRPRQSQVMVTEHAPDRAGGRIVTTEYGPAYFSQPRGGLRNGRTPVIFGGGADRPMANPSSRRRSRGIHDQLLGLRDSFFPELTGQPPSAEWVGPMGFTPDQLPAIGWLRPGLIIAAGFNGYGGSYTTAAGEAASVMALRDEAPDWVPQDVFSPTRFLSDTPLFLNEHDSLWRIVGSLCHQLRSVTRQLSDAAPSAPPPPVRRTAGAPSSGEGRAVEVSLADARVLRPFAHFDDEELSEVLSLMRTERVPAGACLFKEGDPCESCYIIVEGSIKVSVLAQGTQQKLTSLTVGAVFGEMSLIERKPRSATCIVGTEAVLLELDRSGCDELFGRRSPAALKLLAALSEGLIVALRRADRMLVRLERAARGPGPRPTEDESLLM